MVKRLFLTVVRECRLCLDCRYKCSNWSFTFEAFSWPDVATLGHSTLMHAHTLTVVCIHTLYILVHTHTHIFSSYICVVVRSERDVFVEGCRYSLCKNYVFPIKFCTNTDIMR